MPFFHFPFEIGNETRQRIKDQAAKIWFGIRWWAKKFIIIFVRSHMSHVFALVLAVFTVAREIIEFYEWHLLLGKSGWQLFIIILAIFTIGAAFWEFFGNKLATSKQEVRFIAGMNTLLEYFNIFERKLDATLDRGESEEFLKEFLAILLEISSGVLCGKHNVDVAIMFYDKKMNALVLEKSRLFQSPERERRFLQYFNRLFSESAIDFGLPEYLAIPLEEKDESEMGPAEVVFKKVLEKPEKTDKDDTKTGKYVAHLPNKSKKIGVVLKQQKGERYRYKDFFKGWYPSPDNKENFRSVLSVPILSYVDDENNEILGVLNFTTRKRDLFIDRDYIMAGTFAFFISQAIVLNRKKIMELERVGL